MKTSTIKNKIFTSLAVLAFWLLFWEAVSLAVGQVILVPSPLEAVAAWFGLAGDKAFWAAVLVSLFRVTAWILIAVFVGIIGAIISSKSYIFKTLMTPVLHIIRAAPVASFIILALVWITTDRLPIFIAFLMVVPIIWESLETAIEGIDQNLIEMGRLFNLKRHQIFFKIKVPLLMPTFISLCTTSLGFAWKAGVAAEVICRPKLSLGRLLQDSKTYLETPELFAVTATVVVLSIILEYLLKLTSKKLKSGRRG